MWFQRVLENLKPSGFRGLFKGSETVEFWRGSKGSETVWLLSEGFLSGQKPCGFRGF